MASVEIVITLIVLVVGFGGFYVWQPGVIWAQRGSERRRRSAELGSIIAYQMGNGGSIELSEWGVDGRPQYHDDHSEAQPDSSGFSSFVWLRVGY